jgi:hypothetical protein
MFSRELLGFPEGTFDSDTARRVEQSVQELHICEVHDVLAYGHCYLVKPLNLPRMPAMLGTQSSSGLPLGARDATMIIPGSLVLCWISNGFYPVILCSLSIPQGSSKLGQPDSIVAASHAGLFADSAHKIVTGKETAHGFFDFSAGRPIDNLPGDWGSTNEFGLAIILGKLLASIRATDACKVECHYVDQLLRLFGYNLQQYTAGSELESFDDEGEWTEIRSFNPRPWETQGTIIAGQAINVNEDANPNKDSSVFGMEPKDVRQTGLFRFRDFAGALGDMRHRYVMAPNHIFMAEVMKFGRTMTDEAAYIGLMDEIIGLDGSYRLRSAKSIMFEKSIFIPIPEEAAPRDNPEGDQDFTLPADPGEYPASASPDEAMARVLDKETYERQKHLSNAINNHVKDWNTRDALSGDEGKISLPGDLDNEQPPLGPYSAFSQPLPENKDQVLTPDRTQKYYKGKARIGITDDGGFIIEDAYGACIKSVGGNIEISCPGDVIARTGRTVQLWPGKDMIIKAREAVDISSATTDVRVKAEKNLFVLGGNSGDGGVLIENRASTSPDFETTGNDVNIGGLILKASRGLLGIIGDSVYTKSLGGDMIFDANGTRGNIIMYGANFTRYMRSASVDMVAQQGEETPDNSVSILEHRAGGIFKMYGSAFSLGLSSIEAVNHRGSGSSSSVNMSMKGSLTLDGSASATGGFSENNSSASLQSAFQRLRQSIKQEVALANKVFKSAFNIDIGSDDSFGNENTYGYIGVSFRTSEELKLGDIKIYEAPWQRRFRLTAGVNAEGKYGTVWEEPMVYGRVTPEGADDENRPTMPYPGKEAWEDGTSGVYVQVDPQFYEMDANGGHPVARGEKGKNYDKVEPPAEQDGAFKERYPTNVATADDDVIAILGPLV